MTMRSDPTDLAQTYNTSKPRQCLICLDDESSFGCSLQPLQNRSDEPQSCCQHLVCRDCLYCYLIHCENDRKIEAVCPHPECREIINIAVSEMILGREYCPKVWFPEEDKKDATTLETVDETFLEWINENEVQQCKNCHAFIEREDGCDAMQCLCGWRFCWECKAPIRTSKEVCEDVCCLCFHGDGDFYDNILRHEGYSGAPRLATLVDLQDMAAFYERRQEEDEEDRASYQEYDRDEEEDYAVDQREDTMEEEAKRLLQKALAGTLFDSDIDEPTSASVRPLFDWGNEA